MPRDDEEFETEEEEEEEEEERPKRPEPGLGNPLTDQAIPRRGPNKQKRRPPRDIGTTPDPDKFVKQSNDADLVWNELNAWLPSVHMSPPDVLITFRRTVPPGPQGTSVPIGRAFTGAAVAGSASETPGSALVQYAIQWLHIPTTPRGVAATYQVYFTYAGGLNHQGRNRAGKQITEASLSLPSVQEITEAQRSVEFAESQQVGASGFGAPQPGYQPRQQQPAAQPTAQHPMYAFPPQAPQAPPGIPPEMWGFMGRVMEEAFAAQREGRQPVMPQVAAPTPAQVSQDQEERLMARLLLGVQGMLTKAGVIPQPGAVGPAPTTVAAPAVAPPAPVAPAEGSLEGMIKQGINGILQTVVKATMDNVGGSVKTAMGMGAAPAEALEEAPEAPSKPEDALPFAVTPVGAAWADGRPMQVAVTKDDDKNIDWMGTMMANPVVAEKAMEMANGLGEALKNFIQSKTPGAAAPARVVRQIPVGAVPAGVEEAPAPNGAGGWQAP